MAYELVPDSSPPELSGFLARFASIKCFHAKYDAGFGACSS